MVFNAKSKALNLGNSRATNYKHNKLTFQPKVKGIDRKSAHTNRKVEMSRVFSQIAKKGINDSNLSKSELSGLKSLKKRVRDGNLVVASTDKSKRFALLTKDQYSK